MENRILVQISGRLMNWSDKELRLYLKVESGGGTDLAQDPAELVGQVVQLGGAGGNLVG